MIRSVSMQRYMYCRQLQVWSLPRQPAACSRFLSDNLLGHSPMGHSNAISNEGNRIPTASETKIGGIWQATTAKRDKLGELKLELGTTFTSLDAAATPSQKLDLDLVDGLCTIVKQTEMEQSVSSQILERLEWLEEKATSQPEQLHQVQYDELLRSIDIELEHALANFSKETTLGECREYHDVSDEILENPSLQELADQNLPTSEFRQAFETASDRFRIQSTRAVVKHLLEAWKVLTELTDHEVDRAAVDHQTGKARSTIPRTVLVELVKSYLTGNGKQRLDAWWKLLDKDSDGLIDETEMKRVCHFLLDVTQPSLKELFADAIETTSETTTGWRARRRLAKQKKKSLKLFDRALGRHFERELEMPHRLRCIYAWANKAHQDNKIDSVVVEDDGTSSGRKRYVELPPKISLDEFRQVQAIHFPELDTVGTEYLNSYRDDLLVIQGKGRQNQELLRDCALFFSGVCLLDYIILSL